MAYCINQWGYTPLGDNGNIPTTNCGVATNLSAIVENNHISFSWVPPHDYKYFLLHYRIKGSSTPYSEQIVYGSNYKLSLADKSTYEWQVTCVCSTTPYRSGIAVSGPNATTGISISDCNAIGGLTITRTSEGFVISWQDTGAIYYRILVRIKGTVVALPFVTTNTEQVLNYLTPHNEYEVRVISYCNNEEYTTTPWVSILTGDLSCPAITNINSTATANTIIASWLPAGTGNYTYNIYLDDILIISNYGTTSFIFKNLEPNKDYKISIRTNCNRGFSDNTSVIARTKPVICNEPTNIKIINKTLYGFTVTWTPGEGISSQQIIFNNGIPIPLFAEANQYEVKKLPSGSANTVKIKSVCEGRVTTGIETAARLSGCQPPTNLRYTTASDKIHIQWDSVTNAVEYLLRVSNKNTGAIHFNDAVIITEVTISKLTPNTDYLIELIAYCGNDKTPSVLQSATVTTLNTSNCENAQIDEVIIKPRSIYVRWSFASKRTTGFIKVILKDSATGIQTIRSMSVVEVVLFTDLIPDRNYILFIYNDEYGCAPVAIQTYTTPQECTTIDNLSVSFSSDETSLIVNSTYTGETTDLQYSLINSETWTSIATPITYPVTIELPEKGKYKVRARGKCNNEYSEWMESAFICPKPANVSIVTSGNKATVLWDEIEGVASYRIKLTSLVEGEHTFYTNINRIELNDLAYSTNYVVTVYTICDGGVEVPSVNESFQTGGIEMPQYNCGVAVFTAIVQDCEATVVDDTTTGCSIEPIDWSVISSFTSNVNDDDPNDTFFEGTFSFSHSLPKGSQGVLPGGIIAYMADANCRPATTTVLELIIVQGGILLTGTGSLHTNGNITATGTYNSLGNSSLIIRIRGNYNKI